MKGHTTLAVMSAVAAVILVILMIVILDEHSRALQSQHDRIRALEYPNMSLMPTDYRDL